MVLLEIHNHCKLMGHCLKTSTSTNVAESSNITENSRKESRNPGGLLHHQSGAHMLLAFASSVQETKDAERTRRDSNSSTTSETTFVSADTFGPLSIRVGYDTDMNNGICIPLSEHPILPLCQKNIYDEERKNRNIIDVDNAAAKNAIIRKIIEDDFHFNLLREKIRNAKLVTSLAVNLVCIDYIEEQCREEMKRRPSVELERRPSRVMKCISMFTNNEKH